MSIINILPNKIFNRIAAGEVVEKPSSVVKELIENSIDAGATSVSVAIENGGIDYIEVTDNGCGIEKKELRKALLPHATSKISKLSDLDAISTLGFRGEALPSICSVSKLTIISKPKEQESGAIITCNGGEVGELTDYPSIDGTTIKVNNLFYNTPARAKFLKTPKGEESDISVLIARFILGNPNISFKYTVNGQVKLQSYGNGLESAFINVYGVEIIKECHFIDTEKNGIKIVGYIGNNHFSKPNRTYQTSFVNGRYVVNQTINSAITNAYGPYLMKRQYPFYVLSVSLPPDFVDVNVHPNKLEVRFADNRIVYGALFSVIGKVLDGSADALNIVVDNSVKNEFTPVNEVKATEKPQGQTVNSKPTETYKFDKLLFADSGAESIPFDENKVNEKTPERDIFAENKAYIEQLERERAEKSKQIEIDDAVFGVQQVKAEQSEFKIEKRLKFIGQGLNTYLIFEDGDDLVFIDQHAAHERVLFDKIVNSFMKQDVPVQPLLVPIVKTLNGSEFDFISDNLDVMQGMGIDVSVFGERSIKISAVPVYLSEMDITKFIDGILAEVNSLKTITAKDMLIDKFASKACKAAIKSGYTVNEEEANALLEQMNYNLNLKCPHGRPVCIRVTRTEIDKWFKRIV